MHWAARAAAKFRHIEPSASPGEQVQPPTELPFLLACTTVGSSLGQPSRTFVIVHSVLPDSGGQPFHACSLSPRGSCPFPSVLCLLAPLCQWTGGMRWGKYGVGHPLEAGLEGRGLQMETNHLSNIHTPYGYNLFYHWAREAQRERSFASLKRCSEQWRMCFFSVTTFSISCTQLGKQHSPQSMGGRWAGSQRGGPLAPMHGAVLAPC